MSDALVGLASASPRRRALLAQLGVRFRVIPVQADETRHPGEPPGDYVQRVAVAKARAGRAATSAMVPVLGADTAVVLGDEVLGKPADNAAAARLLARLSGREHLVLSAVAITDKGCRVALSRSRVRMRAIKAEEISAYCATGEPLDKAGAYAIQGRAAVFVEHLEGSYSGVMGLPLFETAALLGEVGIRVLGTE